MKASSVIRVSVEVVVALIVSYLLCQRFGWDFLDGRKLGVNGEGMPIALALVVIPEIVRMAWRGEIRKRRTTTFPTYGKATVNAGLRRIAA